MNESTLEVIRNEIEFSMRAVESFRDGAGKNWDDEHFRNIYEDLASIFEGYALCFARTKRRKFENHALRDISGASL
ncbi:hypothetical protein MUO93_05385 [Candidatus Bathyarchaeota archaeon]|nr:hypothetical protein [Candidatus Bathyarchaeota archaeon]